jgi:hypothetical protein
MVGRMVGKGQKDHSNLLYEAMEFGSL